MESDPLLRRLERDALVVCMVLVVAALAWWPRSSGARPGGCRRGPAGGDQLSRDQGRHRCDDGARRAGRTGNRAQIAGLAAGEVFHKVCYSGRRRLCNTGPLAPASGGRAGGRLFDGPGGGRGSHSERAPAVARRSSPVGVRKPGRDRRTRSWGVLRSPWKSSNTNCGSFRR